MPTTFLLMPLNIQIKHEIKFYAGFGLKRLGGADTRFRIPSRSDILKIAQTKY